MQVNPQEQGLLRATATMLRWGLGDPALETSRDAMYAARFLQAAHPLNVRANFREYDGQKLSETYQQPPDSQAVRNLAAQYEALVFEDPQANAVEALYCLDALEIAVQTSDIPGKEERLQWIDRSQQTLLAYAAPSEEHREDMIRSWALRFQVHYGDAGNIISSKKETQGEDLQFIHDLFLFSYFASVLPQGTVQLSEKTDLLYRQTVSVLLREKSSTYKDLSQLLGVVEGLISHGELKEWFKEKVADKYRGYLKDKDKDEFNSKEQGWFDKGDNLHGGSESIPSDGGKPAQDHSSKEKPTGCLSVLLGDDRLVVSVIKLIGREMSADEQKPRPLTKKGDHP